MMPKGVDQLPIIGAEVRAIRLDSAVSISLELNGVFDLRIEESFRLVFADRSEVMVRFAPYENDSPKPTGVTELAQLVHSSIRDARAFPDGELNLGFSNGIQLRVVAESGYEAWTLAGPSFLYVGLPKEPLI